MGTVFQEITERVLYAFPYVIILFITSLSLGFLTWLLSRITLNNLLRIVGRTVFGALTAVLLTMSFALYYGTMYIAENKRPIVVAKAIPEIVDISGKSEIEVRATDPEGTRLIYQYSVRGVGGTVPEDWTSHNLVNYIAPNETGSALVTVLAQDGARVPLTGKDEVLIRVVNPDQVELLNRNLEAARNLLRAENFAEAIQVFSTVVKIYPDLQPAILGRGVAYAAGEEWPEALADYERAIENNSMNELLFLLRARAHEELGNPNQARSDVESFMKLTDARDVESFEQQHLTGETDPVFRTIRTKRLLVTSLKPGKTSYD